MGTAAKVGLAAGAATLLVGGAAAWLSMEGDSAPPPPAVVAAAPSTPSPPAEPPPLPPEALAPPTPPPSPPPVEPGPAGPSVEERLDAPVGELVYEDATVGQVLEIHARDLGLPVEYADPALERTCFATPFIARLRRVPLRSVLDLALGAVESPEEGKVFRWEVREGRLLILLGEPPTPRREPEEEARKRTADEENLLALLKSRRTTFTFSGNADIQVVLSYLSAQQGLNFVVDERVGERCRTVKVTLAARDMPLDEVMDELVRLDADLQWEVRGNVVLVRGR